MADIAANPKAILVRTSPSRLARNRPTLGNGVLKVLGVLMATGAWQAYSMWSNSDLVPGIGVIAEELRDLTESGELWFHLRSTLTKAFSGLAIAFVVGVGAGLLAARSVLWGGAVRQLVSFGYPIPKLALYPVTILVFGLGATSKIAQVALECFFPLFVHAYAGAKSVDRNTLWLARNYGASRTRVLRDVVIPTALPSVLTGLRVAAPIMLIVITVTELIGETRGLGHLITRASAYLSPETAYAVIVVLGTLGFVLDRLIVWIRHRVVFWEKGVSL